MTGKIFVVGMGPGGQEHISPKAMEVMQTSDIIAGYKTYIDLIKPILPEKEYASSGMKKEVERCEEVMQLAKEGKTVSLISSGDAGIYGMAGIMIEVVNAHNSNIDVEVIPGISAATSAASLLGAPLMNDFVTLSLSDLLTPWELIVKRLHAAGSGDFVIALYNPRSKTRIKNLDVAIETLLQYQKPETPVGFVKHAMREKQEVHYTTLGELKNCDIDMFTTVIIGNSRTEMVGGKMVTIRGYKI
ncbi:precorrin-3B C(17)-methyltransferase [Plebeiibacterium marinum]|uniref:Precorrin-3B C(17)-methyltransferase n=1 Tax=Plebeiibacterium marinum TaxID=2992111 RepID=A0AAE3MHJ3_9BACT|nr:precorrin-3B C(17)-methyltransferase [Plebeiobacterium marinum]MCW3807182.1 precorrin-3B C(17)-methyltransferase [Plebeiobacterium marinum]